MLLTFIYVQGMALTYTALGLGLPPQGYSSRRRYSTHTCSLPRHRLYLAGDVNVWLVYPATPSSLQTRLTLMSNRQQGGSLAVCLLWGRLPD